MKKKYSFFVLVFLLIFSSKMYSQENTTDFPVLTGPYLGQKPPGKTPEIFAPGILSTEVNEFNAVFTPKGDEVYFTMNSENGQDIMVIEKKNGQWQERRPASFSGPYREVDPFITQDGKKLYFSSNRPNKEGEEKEDCDFWFVERLASGEWGEAKHLDNPCTQGRHDYYYVSTPDGTVYYSVFDENDSGDLFYISPEQQDKTPYRLDFPINTEHREHDPFIAQDGSFLMFTSTRPGGYGSADLYICFLQSDETWSVPINMGESINSDRYDYCAFLSPDEKYFFFSSSRSGNGDVYWVDAGIIDELKPDNLK